MLCHVDEFDYRNKKNHPRDIKNQKFRRKTVIKRTFVFDEILKKNCLLYSGCIFSSRE